MYSNIRIVSRTPSPLSEILETWASVTHLPPSQPAYPCNRYLLVSSHGTSHSPPIRAPPPPPPSPHPEKVCVLWISCVLIVRHYQPNLNAFISLLWQSYLLAEHWLGSNPSQAISQHEKRETFYNFLWPCWKRRSSSLRVESSDPLRFHLFSPHRDSFSLRARKQICWKFLSGSKFCVVKNYGLTFQPNPCGTYIYGFTLLFIQRQKTLSLPDQSQKLKTLLSEGRNRTAD